MFDKKKEKIMKYIVKYAQKKKRFEKKLGKINTAVLRTESKDCKIIQFVLVIYQDHLEQDKLDLQYLHIFHMKMLKNQYYEY